jgi:hypothetical protein
MGYAGSALIPVTLRSVLLLISVGTLFAPISRAQGFVSFDDFLGRYEAAPPELRAGLAQSFIAWQQARGGFPVRESNGNVVFVYIANADAKEVRLTGDFKPISFTNPYWDSPGELMTRIGSVFYIRRNFESDARLDYRFNVDGTDTRDPLNARSLFSGTGNGEVSELVMPGHPPYATATPRPTVGRGTLHPLEQTWATPKVTIYLPPAYDSSRKYPVIYTADGSAWRDLIRLPTILDNLIADREIQPVIAVMIDAARDRSAWYSYDPNYLAYLKRVVDYVDNSYSTQREPDGRLHAGTSAGGRASAYVAFEFSTLFGKIGMLSPSFSGATFSYLEPFLNGVRSVPPTLDIWISAGVTRESFTGMRRLLRSF